MENRWRTIESAPKDGRSLLLHCDWEPLTVVGFWKNETEKWVVQWDEQPIHLGYEATHWMEIPTVPIVPTYMREK